MPKLNLNPTLITNPSKYCLKDGQITVQNTKYNKNYIWFWQTNNNNIFINEDSLIKIIVPNYNETINIITFAQDNFGCLSDSGFMILSINEDCLESDFPLVIKNVFTPNGDGFNEMFEIDNINYYPNNELTIANRWGKIVYQHTDYKNNWSASEQADGIYFYVLKIKGKAESKGWVQVIR